MSRPTESITTTKLGVLAYLGRMCDITGFLSPTELENVKQTLHLVLENNLPDVRTCRKCGQAYPATLQYFDHDERNKDGLVCICKTCRKRYRKRRLVNNNIAHMYHPDDIETINRLRASEGMGPLPAGIQSHGG